MHIEKRSIAAVVIFSILTCGIYTFYWIYAVSSEVEHNLIEKDGSLSSPGLCVLFSIITCGIYTYYWIYKQSKRIYRLAGENGVPCDDNALVNVILAIFSFSIISNAIIQNDLNKIADRAVRTQP